MHINNKSVMTRVDSQLDFKRTYSRYKNFRESTKMDHLYISGILLTKKPKKCSYQEFSYKAKTLREMVIESYSNNHFVAVETSDQCYVKGNRNYPNYRAFIFGFPKRYDSKIDKGSDERNIGLRSFTSRDPEKGLVYLNVKLVLPTNQENLANSWTAFQKIHTLIIGVHPRLIGVQKQVISNLDIDPDLDYGSIGLVQEGDLKAVGNQCFERLGWETTPLEIL
jgi:hypothetical protein